ncbi:MAG: hypothetical protein HQM11_20530 [SAR324 cluster bacterium]|nr:hypothetical protein [SAR324 cluster bacterium]
MNDLPAGNEDPVVQHIFETMDPEIRQSLTEAQSAGLRQALLNFWKSGGTHLVDIRTVIPFTKVYLVFLMGHDRRFAQKGSSCPRHNVPVTKKHLSTLVVVMLILGFLLLAANLVLLIPSVYKLIAFPGGL